MTQENTEYSAGDQYHSGLTVRGLFALWLPSIRTQVSEQSYRRYTSMVEQQILPVLGETRVDYLTVADIDDFLKEKLKNGRVDGKGGLSMKSVKDLSWLLRSALKLVEWDYSFVVNEHEFIQSQHPKHELELLSVDQAETLVKYLTQHLDRSNAGFLLCLLTGIKLSEICALKDTDLLLEQDRIQIRRTLQRVTLRESSPNRTQTATVEYSPTDSGYRSLTLPTKLSMLLWSLTRQGEGDVFFLTGGDAPIGTRAYQYRFQKVLADSGLPTTINFHMLRHTFSLLWMLRDDDLPGLSRALGHASVKVTQIRYSTILDAAEDIRPSCTKYLCLGAQ
jgi:integrase